MRPSDASAREAIAFLALAAFNAGISFRCVEPMLPQLAADFDTSVSAASAIVTSFAFAYAGSVLVQGPLGDRYGKLRVVTFGTALAERQTTVALPDWRMIAPLTLGLGVAFYLVHNPVQTRATEIAPDARRASLALYACAWGGGQALGAAAMGAAVAFFGYTPMIVAFGAGYAVLGVWLRGNLRRLQP